MSDHEHSDSPVSQFPIEDDEIVWAHGASDTDFIVLRHPLANAHSLPSTLSNLTCTDHPVSSDDASPALDRLSLYDCDSFVAPSTSGQSDNNPPEIFIHANEHGGATSKITLPAPSAGVTSSGSGHHDSGAMSYEDAFAFISRFISSPIQGNDAQLTLLRALIVELGLRSTNAFDLPSTLTSARKILRAEAHVNIKEYIATRHKGQSALHQILKPSKKALRKDIRRGNGASLQWVKQQGLQALLVTCFT